MLGSDRLDYSKGIPERLRAFRNALERYPELRGRVVLIQVVVPSRVEIPRYHEFKQRIDRLVGDINGRFSTSTWMPVQYHFRGLDREDLLAHYRACDIAFITPLKDGMNLVAKEYCACRIEEDGALILSQFAGAAEQLKSGALAGQSLRYRADGGHNCESIPYDPGRAHCANEADAAHGS